MTIKDCISFANANPICSFATVEGDQPRVRMMGFWFADETGFYFQTSSVKEFPAQIEKNPRVEVCFYKHQGFIGTMMRVAGKIEKVEDDSLKKKVLEDRPFLQKFGITFDSPKLLIYRIPHGQARFWTMENNLLPKEVIEF